MNNLEIDKCINSAIRRDNAQRPSGVLGVVSSYDRYTNTATVIVSRQDTDEVEEILQKVPCPVLLGVQSVAPEPGRPCYVIYKGGNKTQALITHYYNHRYSDNDYNSQNRAHVAIPSYLLNT
jgi:hypothetical protein